MTYRLGVRVIVAVAGLLAPSLSMADHDVWKTAASGTWSAGADWVDGSPPDSVFDDATINLPGAYTVSFSADPDPIEKLTVTGGANVTLASSSRPGNPIVPRTLRLVSSNEGIGVGTGSLTLGSTTGGFPSTSHPFHLTADNRVSMGGTLNVKFNSDFNTASLHVTGHLNITGTGSTVTATDSFSTFDGSVEVTLGGSMQSGITSNIGGAVTVSGVGSRWTSSGVLQIGKAAGAAQPSSGVLSVTGGGVVESQFAFLGDDQFGLSGTATVADSGSLWRSTELRIGGAGQGKGTVNVQPGGTVTTVEETVIGSQGRLRLQGGTFDTADFRIESDGQFEWTSGTLHVGVYHGDLSNSSGPLAPGHSAGSTTILGDYGQGVGGSLEIEIGGVAQGTQYDVVNVTQTAHLGGELGLKIINGFVPTPSQAFTILNAVAVDNAFDNVQNGQRLTTLDGGGSFRVNYGPGSAFDPTLVVLSAFQPILSGDFDSDGDVDGNDFLVWQRGGSPNPNSPADLAAWRGNFGFHALTPAGTSIPEPRAEWLAVAGTLVAWGARRRLNRIGAIA